MSVQSFQPFLDFKRRASSQLFGISDRLTIDEFKVWLDEVAAVDKVECILLYVQVYVKSQPFREAVKDKYPDVDVQVIPNVPVDEMNKIIEFCESWEPPEFRQILTV